MNEDFVANSIASQYRAALRMLRAAIEATPNDLWDDDQYENRTWRLVYHTLWGVRFYLGASPDAYVPFDGAVEGAESLGAAWEETSEAPPVERVHAPAELIAYVDLLLDEVPSAVSAVPLNADSGFEWYLMNRLELHVNSIRHVQHHTAKIIERLRAHGVSGLDWIRFGDDEMMEW